MALIFTALVFGEVFNEPLGVTKVGFFNYLKLISDCPRIKKIFIENPLKEKCLVKYDDGTRVKKGRDGVEYIFQETGPLSFDNGKF